MSWECRSSRGTGWRIRDWAGWPGRNQRLKRGRRASSWLRRLKRGHPASPDWLERPFSAHRARRIVFRKLVPNATSLRGSWTRGKPMTTHYVRTRLLQGAVAIAGLSTIACGGGHRLAEFDFEDRTMALVFVTPPAPGLLTGGYHLDAEDDVTELVVKTTSGVARDMEARRARARLDSAARRVNLQAGLAERTLERTSRYLGMRPVERVSDADFLLEVHMSSYGLDARGTTAAYLYSNAEVVLLERRTGHEVWNARVHGTD